MPHIIDWYLVFKQDTSSFGEQVILRVGSGYADWLGDLTQENHLQILIDLYKGVKKHCGDSQMPRFWDVLNKFYRTKPQFHFDAHLYRDVLFEDPQIPVLNFTKYQISLYSA